MNYFLKIVGAVVVSIMIFAVLILLSDAIYKITHIKCDIVHTIFISTVILMFVGKLRVSFE